MEVTAIVKECERVGVTVLAITDHVNELHQVPLHLQIREDIEALETGVEVYFGVELNYTGLDEVFPFSADLKEEYGFQVVIGGIHRPYLDEYDPRQLVDIQHRHHLKTCSDPLVDVLVHPYWFGKGDFDGWPWAEWMKHVPEAYARELGQASRETGTAIEINACATLTNPSYPDDFVPQYVDYLALVADAGATFTVGSDAHDINRLQDIQAAWRVVDQLRLPDERIWRPKGRP
jgi:histidinol phosphatase-like PHP family hydrolase